jgi:hypothetical protein
MISLAQQQCYFLFRPTRSARFECPDLSGAFIDRDHGKFARAFYRKSLKVIHDRLPFLDLPDSASTWALSCSGFWRASATAA